MTPRNMRPAELLAVAQLVAERMPDAELAKNDVGNLTILSATGEYVGWVDLRWGEVTFFDAPAVPAGNEEEQ